MPHFSSGMNWDQLMLPIPKSSSSRPEKLMSTKILLKLSFMVSKMSPSVSERLAKAAPSTCSSREEGADARSSRGELKRGTSLNGVLLKLKGVWLWCWGVKVVLRGVRMGLKSSMWPSFPRGVSLHDSGRVAGGLLGVEEAGCLLLMGVLKAYPLHGLSDSSFGSASASCVSWKAERSDARPESNKVLSG